ncbi:MAG: ABC transporter permease [Acidimicrobiales bacterium]
MSAWSAHTAAELRLQLRNGEQLLVTLGIPLGLLVFFGTVEVLPVDGADRIGFLVPGIVALAVMSSAMVAMGIATGFERSYLVLKRLAVTPLGRPALIGAKIAVVAAVEVVQLAAIIVVGLLLGWTPAWAGIPGALGAVVLGTAAFGGLGLSLAGRLRGPLNLAAQNALYLALLLTGGLVFSLDRLPAAVATLAGLLPTAALATVLRATIGNGAHETQAWLVLAGWSVVTPAVAIRTFRWW